MKRRALGALLATRALSWQPPAHRVAELFPPTADALARNADPDAVFVVTGANRGVGAAMVEQLTARTAGTVVACARDPATVAAASPRVRAAALDVRDDASIDALAAAVGDRVDVLLNCAGVLHDAAHQPERSLDRLSRDWLLQSVDVNCAGPILVTRALRRALAAGRRGSGAAPSRPASVVANLSARVGSATDNGLGGWHSYRASKAALNMLTKNCAIELKKQRTACVALHPGTTDTGLSKPFQKNVQPAKLFPAAFTAAQLLDIVDGVELEVHSGGFYAWDGESIEF